MRETRVGWLVMYKEAKDAIVSKNDFLEVVLQNGEENRRKLGQKQLKMTLKFLI